MHLGFGLGLWQRGGGGETGGWTIPDYVTPHLAAGVPYLVVDPGVLAGVQSFSGTDAEFLAANPDWPLFKDSAGTVPAYLPEHPVARVRDQNGNAIPGLQSTDTGFRPTLKKTAGGVYYLDNDGDDFLSLAVADGNYTVAWKDPEGAGGYGPGLGVNGDFSSGMSGWGITAGDGTATVTDGELIVSAIGAATTTVAPAVAIPIISGHVYEVTIVARHITGSRSRVFLGANNTSNYTYGIVNIYSTSTDTYTVTFTAGGSTLFVKPLEEAGKSGAFDSISVKEVTFLENQAVSGGYDFAPTRFTEALITPDAWTAQEKADFFA